MTHCLGAMNWRSLRVFLDITTDSSAHGFKFSQPFSGQVARLPGVGCSHLRRISLRPAKRYAFLLTAVALLAGVEHAVGGEQIYKLSKGPWLLAVSFLGCSEAGLPLFAGYEEG